MLNGSIGAELLISVVVLIGVNPRGLRRRLALTAQTILLLLLAEAGLRL
jgi:hypothetical protein